MSGLFWSRNDIERAAVKSRSHEYNLCKLGALGLPESNRSNKELMITSLNSADRASMSLPSQSSITMPTAISNCRKALSIFFAAMICVLLAIIAIRVMALQLPLERDEGEFAFMGQLMLSGVPPYQEAFGQKLPGIYIAYAIIMSIFGQNSSGIHLGLLLVNLITIFLLFLMAKELFGYAAASIAACSYALLSIDPSVLGLAAHATHFVVLFAVAGIACLLQSFKGEKNHLYFISGILFGFGFLMKQPGFFFGVLGVLLLIFEPAPKKPSLIRKLAMYIAGFSIPYLIVCLALYAAGVFGQFWFWTYEYAKTYALQLSISSGHQLFRYSFGQISSHNTCLWICGSIGVVLVFLSKHYRRHWLFFEAFLISSFLALSAGFYFREHYFVLLLPVTSLLIGITLGHFSRTIMNITGKPMIGACITVGLFIAFSSGSLVQQFSTLRSISLNRLSHVIYGTNPFPESIHIAKYLNARTSDSDRIAIMGSEPQIFFYAKRKSVTPFIYMYPMMESHKYAKRMQLQLIKQIITVRPKYIVFVDVPTSWLVQPHSEGLLFSWVRDYLRENYVKTVAINIKKDGSSDYFWGAEARNLEPLADGNIGVFELRP